MEKAAKIAYVSPPHGSLEIAIIRDANPRVLLSLDLGIPNFTVFSMTLPLAQDSPKEMSGLIAEAVHVLLDEVIAFMMSLEFEKIVMVDLYTSVLTAFKSMSTKSPTDQSKLGQDPVVSTFEGTFKIPMDFINETQKCVITAKKIERPVKFRHIELTYSPKDKIKPTDTARVIRMYRNRSLKQQPKPMYVIVYDALGRATGTIPVGKNFKNELLKRLPKKGSSIDFTPPVSFGNEQEMKSSPLIGIPRAISLGGMTYQPEAMSGGDMALYHSPQDYIVKFPDGRSAVFPGRPTFSKMRTLNFPVPKNRFKWTIIPEEVLAVQTKPSEEVKEAGNEGPRSAEQRKNDEAKSMSMPNIQSSDTLRLDQIDHRGNERFKDMEQIWLKPQRTYDDLVPLEQLQKRLVRDKLQGKPIYEGLMLIDKIGYHGTFEGKTVLVIPQYYIRRYGVKKDNGNWQVYHLRSDGRAQKVIGEFSDDKFLWAKPITQAENEVYKTARPTENKIELIRQRYKFDEATIEQIILTDPTEKDYVATIAAWVARKLIRLPEDTQKIKTQLEEFTRLKRSPNFTGSKDIQSYTPATLFEIVNEAKPKDLSKKEQERIDIQQGSQIVVNQGDYLVYKVTGEKALIALSGGTNWCTAQPKHAKKIPRQLCDVLPG